MTTFPVKCEFTGGAELFFGGKSLIPLGVSEGCTLGGLVVQLCEHLSVPHNEFCVDEYAKPGILVLVNDVDAEVFGGGSYILAPNDTVVFLSTLHGG